ncbi:MAG: hypothetical protein PHV62_03105 [Sulfuricurvum sp.]|nr:hypothetical protein [Sulfuricurvum sp.]
MKSISVDIPVHDIAPPLEIREYSIYWFMVLIAVIFVVGFVLVKQIRKKKKSKKVDARSERYESFSHIEMGDPKAAAYAICEQGFFFAHDNEETSNTYQALFKRLEPYKYAPRVESIDEETLALYRSYQNMIST